MADYMIFRAVTPPGFNFDEYSKHSGEPIRFDPVTVVEADTERDAVNALVSATGVITSGFAVIECTLIDFSSKGALGRGGKLTAVTEKSELLESADAKLERLTKEIDEIKRLSES